MKKLLAILIVVFILLTTTATAFANTYGNPTESFVNYDEYNQNGTYYNNNSDIYYGNNNYDILYVTSPWFRGINNNGREIPNYMYLYNNPVFQEEPKRGITRIEMFLSFSGSNMASIIRQGGNGFYSSNRNLLRDNFSDTNSIEPNDLQKLQVLYELGILKGYPDGTLRPYDLVTRAEAACILDRFDSRFWSLPKNGNGIEFTDIYNVQWAQNAIRNMARAGLLNGSSEYEPTFSPSEGLSIEQDIAIDDRTVGIDGKRREDVARGKSQVYKIIFKKPFIEDTNNSNYNGTKISSLYLSSSNISLNVNQTKTVTITISPSNVSLNKLTFESKYGVAEAYNPVYSNGKCSFTVMGNKQGTETIYIRTVDGSNITKTLTVNVGGSYNDDNNYNNDILVSTLSVTPLTTDLSAGQSDYINATVYPSNAYNKTLRWGTENSNVATVSQSGRVNAIGQGTTRIWAETTDASNIRRYITVNVLYGNNNNYDILVSDINIGNQNISIRVDESFQASASVYPSNATNRNLSWSSSNNSIAIVNSSGNITGRQNGNCVITVSAQDNSGVSKQYYVTVTAGNQNNDTVAPVVELLGSGSVVIGQTITLNARATDNVGVLNFNIRAQDVGGIISGLVVQDVTKNGQQFTIKLIAVLPGQYFLGIANGVATDAAGNSSDWSNEAIVTITAN